MNIGTVEKKTGLMKANIRFYETEGLISPSRLENGYRDYTDENIETLLKIKLLRELKVPLETIRSLQDGSESMRDILSRQFELYALEQGEIENAGRVCRIIYDDGAEYSSMDAEKYLSELHTPRNVSGEYIKSDAIPYESHPWFRYFARVVDLGIYTIPALYIFFVLPGNNIDNYGSFANLAVIYASIVLMFLFEPLMLHLFATTPGKFIAGIRVYDENGNKLTYLAALKRLAHLFLEGMGLYIPIVQTVLYIVSFKKCKKNELEWDENISYVYRSTADLRIIACIALVVLLAVAQFFCENATRLPPNRGELTVEEFAENFNFYNDVYHADNYYYDMDAEGKWYPVYPNWEVGGIDPPADFVFTTDENGYITSISMDTEYDDSHAAFYYLYRSADAFAYASYASVMAQDDFRVFSLDWLRISTLRNENFYSFYDNISLNMHNVSITWTASDGEELFVFSTGSCHGEIVIN